MGSEYSANGNGHPASVELVDWPDDSIWNAFVCASPYGTICHLTSWARVVRDVFGHPMYFIEAKNSAKELTGLLPLVRIKSRIFGDFLVSMPFMTYGGALGLTDETEVALLKRAIKLGAEIGVDHIELRDHKRRETNWPVRTDKVAMRLELPETPDELAKQLGSKRRSQIRRPRRENPHVRIGHIELVDDFYTVFARNMRDLGTPVYPKRLFSETLRRFSDKAAIISICIGDELAAAGFLTGFRDTMEIQWASTVRKFNPIGINMLLYWEALQLAIREGYRGFEFGRSTIDSGTYRFKKQWGAAPHQLYWHYWLKPGEQVPYLNPSNPKYGLAIKLWQKLPLVAANWLGPRIVRNLP